MNVIRIFLLILLAGSGLQSCCEPDFKNSVPTVLFNTYRDTVIKDRLPPGQGNAITDSGYYPVYEFQVRNDGSDADTFTMIIGKNGFDFSMKQFVEPQQTVTFRTPGPVPDTAEFPAQWLYFSMFRQDPDDLEITVLDPDITFLYGEVYQGDEGCNVAPSRTDIDARLFH